MAKRKQERTGPSRKQERLTRAEREQERKLLIIVGSALGLAVLVLVAGLAIQYLLTPASAVARVGNEKISTRHLWNRAEYEQLQLINRLQNTIDFQRQIDPTGEQGFFTSQIQQLQSLLRSDEGLTNQVLEDMIDESVIRQAAAEFGVSANEDEITTQLEELIAGQIGAVTAPQATATAEALAVATPTPTLAPTATPTATVETTATAAPPPEPQPTPTAHVLTQTEYDESYQNLLTNISNQVDMNAEQTAAMYRELITADILRNKLLETIGDQMPTSGEQVRASHILIAVDAEAGEEADQAALAKAISITQRLEAGEDFGMLAAQYSDDPGSGAQGGDLGFFGRGAMVPEFEDAAFNLKVGELSEPVRTQFGYHIIKLVDRTPGDPDFNLWLQQRKADVEIERNLSDSRLPDLPPVPPQLFASSTTPGAQPTAPPSPTVTN